MIKYIDAVAFRREIDKHTPFDKYSQDHYPMANYAKGELVNLLAAFPPADVAPVRHGHWMWGNNVDSIGAHGAECSVCGGYTEDNTEYCGCCGAKMDDELQRKHDTDHFGEEKEDE